MIPIVAGIVVVLHGLVHLLYAGHSSRMFELSPGLAWPDGAWTQSHQPHSESWRRLATVACVVASIFFVLGGTALMFGQDWWRGFAAAAAIVSSAVWLLFWNGDRSHMADQGAIGLLINVAVLAAAMWAG